MRIRTVLVLGFLAAVGCDEGGSAGSGQEGEDSFVWRPCRRGELEFRFPAGWKENPQEHPFDLQCLSPEKYAVTGVWVWHRDNLAADKPPLEIFQTQVEDLRSKRSNFRIIEDKSVSNRGSKRLTSLVASGEKGMNRNYYRFTLIEFPDGPDLFAVALQTCVPSEWDTLGPVLEKITASARVVEESP